MKKIFLTAFVAAAFAFGMSACCNNNANEAAVDTLPEETEMCCEHHHHCNHECTCEDTNCAKNNCETCVNKGTENCCKVKAGEKPCCDGEHHHEGCKGNHEGCQGNHEGCKGNHECCGHHHESDAPAK